MPRYKITAPAYLYGQYYQGSPQQPGFVDVAAGTSVPVGWVEVGKDDQPLEQKTKQTPTMSEMAKAKHEQDQREKDRLTGGDKPMTGVPPKPGDKPPQK